MSVRLMVFMFLILSCLANAAPKMPRFPIAVWLQSPDNAAKYQKAGINLYIGLWQGPTEEQLTALKNQNMPVICEQNAVGLKHVDDPIILAWMQQDEPDNAQSLPAGGYGPCVPPQKVVDIRTALKAKDPSRPILLNLGQGLINPDWIGRGSGASPNDYKTYVDGGDIVSFDIYPVAGSDTAKGVDTLGLVGKGVERLVRLTNGKKPIWCCIECTCINGTFKPTPKQVRSEVWMAIIHGAKGLVYFVHEFKPFNEHALLDDPDMLRGVTDLNAEVQKFEPVLSGPTIVGKSNVQAFGSPIAIMEKRSFGARYLFTVGMKNETCRAFFTLEGLSPNAVADVVGEKRTIPIINGKFEDAYQPYGVHVYIVREKR